MVSESKSALSRRNFIKSAAIGAGAVAVGAAAESARAVPPPKKWDMETDVIVVGFGGAGGAAAITAKDAGADVIILEKAPEGMAGGNSGCNAGYFVPPSTREGGIAYYKALDVNMKDTELVEKAVDAIMAVPEWAKAQGAPVERVLEKTKGFFPTLPGAVVDFYTSVGGGRTMFDALLKQVEQRRIKVLYDTPGQQLVQDGSGGPVVGVIAKGKSQTLAIKARKAVIMTCGGYENNPEMISRFNYPGSIRFIPWGTPYNQGEGVWMASAAGAKLWHLPNLEWADFALKVPSEKVGSAIPVLPHALNGGYIYVNRRGNRFMNENRNMHHYRGPVEAAEFDHHNAEYPNLPCWIVFDEAFRLKNSLVPKAYYPRQIVGYAFVKKLFEGWSPDNSKEIEKGWILKGETIEELAQKASIDPKGLAATIAKFSESAADGKDPAFGRGAKTLGPIAQGPFYAAELACCMINTQGGPVHNAKAQVMGVDDKPIPRLYVAGELGSFVGHLYQGGTNFPEAIGFGRIAGQNAAAEKPWSK